MESHDRWSKAEHKRRLLETLKRVDLQMNHLMSQFLLIFVGMNLNVFSIFNLLFTDYIYVHLTEINNERIYLKHRLLAKEKRRKPHTRTNERRKIHICCLRLKRQNVNIFLFLHFCLLLRCKWKWKAYKVFSQIKTSFF